MDIITATNRRADKLAKTLRSNAITVEGVKHATDLSDADIDVGNGFGIQVSTVDTENTLTHFDGETSTEYPASDLKHFMKTGVLPLTT